MPRTIESILAAHEAATQRRKAGRPIWDHSLRIKHLLNESSSDERAQELGAEVAKILRASSWLKREQALIAADPENAGLHVTSEIEDLADELADVTTLEHFNEALDELYDLADAHRVWIE